MLFRRYASPLPLLDQMIRTRRLNEFVSEFVNIHNEELNDQTQWEFFLHKVFDKSWAQFQEAIKNSPESEKTLSDEELKSTVIESAEIIKGFCPSIEKEG